MDALPPAAVAISIPIPDAEVPTFPAPAPAGAGSIAPEPYEYTGAPACAGGCAPAAGAAAAPSATVQPPTSAAHQQAAPPLPTQLPCRLSSGTRACLGRQVGAAASSTRLDLDCSLALGGIDTAFPLHACVYASAEERPPEQHCSTRDVQCAAGSFDRGSANGTMFCHSTPALDAQGPRMLVLTVELRSYPPGSGPWGVAMAAFELLVVVMGAARVEALDALPASGRAQGAVKLSAALQYPASPPGALGKVRLRTRASVDGIGAAPLCTTATQ